MDNVLEVCKVTAQTTGKVYSSNACVVLWPCFVIDYRGQTPAEAEANFLLRASQLDTYGVDPHPVKVLTQKYSLLYILSCAIVWGRDWVLRFCNIHEYLWILKLISEYSEY